MSWRAQRNSGANRAAFSLLELVIVLAILTLMVAVAVPRYASSATRYRADRAATRIASDLALARRRAKATGINQTVSFTVTSDQYTMPGLPDLKDPTVDYTVTLNTEPYKATLTGATFGDDSHVIFDGYGAPDSNGAIVIRVGSEQRTVVVDGQTGKASVQ